MNDETAMNNKDLSCKACEHRMVEALFGEIDPEAIVQLERHLASCDACRETFTSMKATLQWTAMAEEEAVPEPHWPAFRERLRNRIHERETGQSRAPLIPSWEWGKTVRLPGPVWGRQLALAVVLVLIGAFIGRNSVPEHDDGIASSASTNEGSTEISPTQLALRTQRYLDRSNVLLLGLVNFDVGNDDLRALNFAHKQTIAGDLVAEAGAIKTALDARREVQLRMLIEELEKVLLQIANLEVQDDLPGIEMIQQGVDHRALLLKINLETMKLNDQAETADGNPEDASIGASIL